MSGAAEVIFDANLLVAAAVAFADPERRETLRALAVVARWSGSSRNSQPWRFIVLRDLALIRELWQATRGDDATGSLSPRPSVRTRLDGTPCETRKFFAAAARRSERPWL